VHGTTPDAARQQARKGEDAAEAEQDGAVQTAEHDQHNRRRRWTDTTTALQSNS